MKLHRVKRFELFHGQLGGTNKLERGCTTASRPANKQLALAGTNMLCRVWPALQLFERNPGWIPIGKRHGAREQHWQTASFPVHQLWAAGCLLLHSLENGLDVVLWIHPLKRTKGLDY